MELSFSHKTASVYREKAHPIQRAQETFESVVPDTDEDIGRILSTRASVLLKSKEATERGVLVGGEIQAVLLYITENENGVACVKLHKPFEMAFELGRRPEENLCQIRLSVCSTEARILNPRKVSATVELLGELSCYSQEEIHLETLLNEQTEPLLHVRREEGETSAVNAVCEKSFALNDQLRFPEGKPVPDRLASQEIRFSADSVQQVGSRAVIKGRAFVDLCYFSEGVDYPLFTRFELPFSQIVDTGAENCSGCTLHFEVTSVWFELIDTISGEKALDTEVHAVLELVSRETLKVSWFSDAYCNRMPLQSATQSLSLQTVSEPRQLMLSGEGSVAIAEDCSDVLCVLPTLGSVSLREGELSAPVGLDILYRTEGGGLAAVHRSFEPGKQSLPAESRLVAARLSSADVRPEGRAIRCRMEVEAQVQNTATREITELSGVVLQEEDAWKPEQFPSVTLVRAGGEEELWTLAKRFHSSVEAIRALNGEERIKGGKALLIPREG